MIPSVLSDNILIRQDLRRFRNGWKRKPWVWIGLTLFAAHVVFCAFLFIDEAFEFKMEDEGPLYWYFTGFHIYLHLLLPFICYKAVRRGNVREMRESCQSTPIPKEHYFWWLWFRCAALFLLPLLAVYLTLCVPYPWLIGAPTFESFGPLWEVVRESFEKCGQLVREFGILKPILGIALPSSLFAAPWIKDKYCRRAIYGLAFGALFLHPVLGEVVRKYSERSTLGEFMGVVNDGPEDKRGLAFPVQLLWHPLVTVPYFLATAAWSIAVGVWVGMKSKNRISTGLILALWASPLLEWGIYNVTYIDDLTGEFVGLYSGFGALYMMLVFYVGTAGTFVIGLKWNLLIWLGRRMGRQGAIASE